MLEARAKMSLSRAQNIFMPANINSIVILYRSINTMNDSVILQNDIEKLVSWSKTWQMQFNVTKCQTMMISRKKEPVLMDYYIDG